MDYVDFDLLVEPKAAGVYKLRVLESPAGETEAELVWPFDKDQLAARLSAFDIAREASRARGLELLEAPNGTISRAEALEDIQRFGRELFDLLMPEKTVRRLYDRSAATAEQQGKGLRVRLRIEAPDLAALPWEFIFDGGLGAYLGLSQQTPITRYLQVEARPARLRVEPPLRILGMVATPSDLEPLDAAAEKRHMNTAVAHLLERGAIELEWLEGDTVRALQRALRPHEGPWHIFHFIGHGGFDDESGEGFLMLVDEEGKSDRVSATQLAGLLGDHRTLRLAVLNSCEGARADSDDAFSSTGSIVTRQGLPAVVSMQYEITDDSALEFSRTFYDCLAEEYPVDMAVTEARKAILNHWERNTMEWGTPVLHMRSPDGELFRLDARAAVFRDEEPPTGVEGDDTRQASVATRPLGGGRQGAPPERTEFARTMRTSSQEKARLDRGLVVLRQKVKRFWVDGVLADMLDRSRYIDLEMELMRAAVASPFGDGERGGVELVPPGQKVGDLFDEEGRSLLILGEPGAGKTTTLLALCADLIDEIEGEKEQDRPIPVVVHLIGWDGQPLREWLADELAAKYTIPKRATRRWLAEERLLPLMDGLDEVAAEAREACVEAINRFAETSFSVGLVVSSRYREYTDLSSRLVLNSAVRLRQLSRQDVIRHVEEGGERLAGLRRVLERDSALQIEARSPLMLGIMTSAYSDLTPQELAAEAADTAEARRTHIFDTYVDRMFRRQQELARV